MVERKVLIVDDDDLLEESIGEYYACFREISSRLDLKYNLNFIWEKSMSEALNRLNQKAEVIDVIIIDYDFHNDDTGTKGIELVKRIRSTINKRCKIIFYTMHAYHKIGKGELVSLINSNVFRFINKDGENFPLKYGNLASKSDQIIVESVIDAIEVSDPISRSLENFLLEYSEILKDATITIGDTEYPIQEVVDSIRLDTDIGNVFINNMLKISILNCTNFLD